MKVWFFLMTLRCLLGVLEAALPGFWNSEPQINHGSNYPPNHNEQEIRDKIQKWNSNSGTNIWEHSGLKEGDIMEPKPQKGKNVVRSRSFYWPNAIVPYILESGMSSSHMRIVKSGMDWLMAGSCLKFRPRHSRERDYLYILSDSAGCWSYIGRQGGAQAVGLQSNGCFEPGVVAHELLHAVGFLHEQSATNRDEYIYVNFTNIEEDKYSQFMKYNASLITDYNVGYDYDSLMHYSRKAFSKNGRDTIVPYQPGVEIGQRSHVSEKDFEKLNFKYCNKTVEAIEQATQSSRPTTRPGTVVKPSGSKKPGTNTAGRPGGSVGNRPGNNAGG
ncbi:Hypothetical predicted protein [Cloeon dipterum]|uniref:Metalloendopeptidase n=1 Tax=Cloeon dipterum TaxID=197152 RepID=A0A8S1CWU0_9INSE|nr:Hypothetical predicted protein [Cloeon dipterum]